MHVICMGIEDACTGTCISLFNPLYLLKKISLKLEYKTFTNPKIDSDGGYSFRQISERILFPRPCPRSTPRQRCQIHCGERPHARRREDGAPVQACRARRRRRCVPHCHHGCRRKSLASRNLASRFQSTEATLVIFR